MKVVFFDIDDTLYDQAQPFAHAVAQVLGKLPAPADELYRSSRAHSGEVFAAYGAGSHPTDAIYVRRMQETMADFGVSITEEQARTMQRVYTSRGSGAMRLSEPMAESLAWCAGHAELGVGVITNGRTRMQRAKLAVLGCRRWIKPQNVFISEEQGMAKPDPRLFWHACETMGTVPESCLYVGDAYDVDVVGAHAAGMPMVWFNRRHHPVPQGPDAARATWTVDTEDELFDLLRMIV